MIGKSGVGLVAGTFVRRLWNVSETFVGCINLPGKLFVCRSDAAGISIRGVNAAPRRNILNLPLDC